MDASHIAGGGFGAVLGAVVAGVLSKYHIYTFTDVDAAVVGSAFLSAGVGIGHAVGKYGLAGIVKLLIHGVPKAAT